MTISGEDLGKVEMYAELWKKDREMNRLQMKLVSEKVITSDGKFHPDLNPKLRDALVEATTPPAKPLVVMGQHICATCDDAIDVTLDIGVEPELPSINITGLHLHIGDACVELPNIYIMTHDQLMVRERTDT